MKKLADFVELVSFKSKNAITMIVNPNIDKKVNTFSAPKFSVIQPPRKGPIRGPKAITIEM